MFSWFPLFLSLNLTQREYFVKGIITKEKGTPVILDDAEARAVAQSLRLQYHGTIMVPYETFVRGLISRAEFVKIVTALSKILWVSPAVVAEILRKAEEVKK